MSEINLLWLSQCCQRGSADVKILTRELKQAGIEVVLNKARNQDAKEIMLKNNFSSKERRPLLYIQDLMFLSEKCRDKKFVQDLVKQLKDWKEGIEKHETFLSGVVKK